MKFIDTGKLHSQVFHIGSKMRQVFSFRAYNKIPQIYRFLSLKDDNDKFK